MRDLNAAIRNNMLDKHARRSDSANRAAFLPKGPGARSGKTCTTAFAIALQGRSRAALFRIHLIQLETLSMRKDSYKFNITGYFPRVPLFWASVTAPRDRVMSN